MNKQLGRTGISVSAIGPGAMPLLISGKPSESQAIETIHHALSMGVTLIDTADAYCLDETDKHHNERLISKALEFYNGDISQVVVITKGGSLRTQGDWIQNGNPDYLQNMKTFTHKDQ